MPWASTALSVGGSLLSGGLGSSSAKKAASKARQMAREAIARQEAAKQEIGFDLDPYVTGGGDSQRKLSYLLGTSDPQGKQSYTFSDFLQYNLSKLRDMGFKGSKIEAQATADATKQYQRYMDQGQDNEATKKNYGFRDLIDKPLDTSDGKFGSLLDPFTNEDFVQDPGYNFRQQEGEKGVNRALAARGGFDSGAALKAIARYNQDFASNEFTNAFNRDASTKGRIFDFLSGDANRGLSATGTKGNVFMGAANAQNQAAQTGTRDANDYSVMGANALNNGLQSAIGNLIYGMERNRGVTSNNPYVIKNATPTNASTPTPWYLT